MAITQLNDSKIPQMVSTGLYTEQLFDIRPDMVHMILDILVSGTTEALNSIKSTDYPVALKFCKSNGDFIAAAIVEFFPNEDTTKPGNWNYSWTFDKDDMPKNAIVETPYSSQLLTFFRGSSISKFGFDAKKSEYYGDTMIYVLQMIKKWLDENAAADEEVGVALDGIIQFRVAVENGEKVFSAEPDGEIKQLIKDDAKIEK